MQLSKHDLDATASLHALEALNLDTTDFDDGIRAIKTGLRADTVDQHLLTNLKEDALRRHDAVARGDDGLVSELPPSVASKFPDGWQVLPHNVHFKCMHMRGSFPDATKAVGSLLKCKTSEIHTNTREHLAAIRTKLYKPVIHAQTPTFNAADPAVQMREEPCHTFGFCVHGADGNATKHMV